jgi:peptide-N4-(N-acetyl-beta-glucosaminyl)asparagine amidase
MPRNKCAEGVLAHIIGEIKALRRRDMDKTERFRLVKEDMQEEEYLRSLIIEAIAYSVSKIVPSADGESVKSDRPPRTDPDAQKAAEQQQERARIRAIRRANPSSQPPRDRDQHQQ